LRQVIEFVKEQRVKTVQNYLDTVKEIFSQLDRALELFFTTHGINRMRKGILMKELVDKQEQLGYFLKTDHQYKEHEPSDEQG
jgi:hypothetical protein